MSDIKNNISSFRSLIFEAFVYFLIIASIAAALLLLMFSGSFLLASSIWLTYAIAFAVSVALFYAGRLFFIEKNDLKKAKNNLTKLLENSEDNRIKAEMERDKTSTIVNSFSDGLMILDEKNNFFSINPEAEKILSINSSKLLAKSFQSMTYFPKAEPVLSALNESFKDIHRKEIGLGKDFVIELSVIPLGSSGKNTGQLIVLHDISREKIVEKMKTEFVSLAAHQLRTPLSIIKWTMSMLKNGDFGKLTKRQDELVESAFRNNERLISIVNDLLDVTRIEEGRYLYKTVASDMREIIKLSIEANKDQAKKRKIKIEFTPPERFPEVILDPEKIKLVIQNFIDNAIQYSSEKEKIIISLKNDDKNIELKVQDFGIGIPKDQQNKIFTKFFRGDNAAKVNTHGSGLGLFLSKNIVEAHGGKIWLQSEENSGTSLYFSLPIKKK